MPYLEIISPPLSAEQKARAARAMTDAVVDAFGVALSTVTVYFVPVPGESYMHAGVMGAPQEGVGRVFIKVHAYRRDLAARQRAAQAIDAAFAGAIAPQQASAAVYFIDRAADEVAHYGQLGESTPAARVA